MVDEAQSGVCVVCAYHSVFIHYDFPNVTLSHTISNGEHSPREKTSEDNLIKSVDEIVHSSIGLRFTIYEVEE